ncbi:hypothetical protein ACHMW6_28940 [Pseudoduganella sp. UC29_106]|uniref:hypothetical protein n=1 Tax=Pseudoduganella sp. UC29_106 TaxID=3374553 RepID=UPI003756B92D
MKFAVLAVALLMAGCAANSGVVSIGQDAYMVTRQAATGFSGASTLKAEAITEGNQFCTRLNKQFQLTSAVEAQPPYVFGNYPKADVMFKCVQADTPAAAISKS